MGLTIATSTLVVLGALVTGCTRGESPELTHEEAAAFCAAYDEYLLKHDSSDPEPLIRAIATALPPAFDDDLALGFYPYGGETAGLDTSGTRAQKGRDRIDRLYETECRDDS